MTEPARSLRVVAMGSTAFLLPSLERLAGSAHEIVAVYTRPPAPKGRGHQLQTTPVHDWAERRGLPVETPRRFKDEGAVDRLATFRPDIVVTGAYGLILPKAVLDLPRLGCVNLHASLLPRWRGAAPIERAIMAGDERTGICLFRMETGLDTGPVCARAELPIGPRTTAGDLHESLALLAADLLLPTLAGIADGTLVPVAQPDEGVTYAAKLERDEGRLDPARPAIELDRMVRALAPRPGAFVMLGGERLSVHAATPVDLTGEPGTVIGAPLVIACGEGALRLDVVQRPGKRPMSAEELVRGRPVPPGTRLDPG